MGHGRNSVGSSPLTSRASTCPRGFQRSASSALELDRKVGLDKLEDDDVNSLFESIGEELSTEELDELEKQQRQMEEEEVEAEQHLTTPPMKQLTMKILQHFSGIINQGLDYLEEVDPDYERVMANLALYEQLLYKKGREATHANFDAFFRKASIPEGSASDEPHSNKEPHTSNESQPSTSEGGFTHPNVPSTSPSSSDVDDPGVF